MNDEQEHLASAYLDGALTDEERARAEADPDVMAAVQQLRELRRALSVVDAPNAARRDAAINAALGVFDAERAAAPPPARLRARRRTNTWMIGAAAAALVLVIAGGILASRSNDQGGGDDSAGGAALLPETTTQGRLLAGDAGGGAEATAGTGAAPEARAPTTSAPGTFAAAATVPTPQESRLLPVFTSPGELTALAAQSRDDQLSTADAAAPPCNEGRWLGPAIYMLDGVNTPVDVYLARRAGQVRAVDPSTCAVLVTAPAP